MCARCMCEQWYRTHVREWNGCLALKEDAVSRHGLALACERTPLALSCTNPGLVVPLESLVLREPTSG